MTIFHARMRHFETQRLEIRESPAGYGRGVFARQTIRAGELVSEYAGRLLPVDGDAATFGGAYVFLLEGCYHVDAALYGNASRFVNHHCTRPNVAVREIMYGRRRVLAYRATCDVRAGEELFVHYGPQYWVPGRPCLCDASERPHVCDADSGDAVPLDMEREIIVSFAPEDDVEGPAERRPGQNPKTRSKARPREALRRSKRIEALKAKNQAKVLERIHVLE